MSIFAIADLHLSLSKPEKNMLFINKSWENYIDTLKNNWLNNINDSDIVLIPGDISWCMNLSEIKDDFDFLNSLPGKKILTKGNHDYWWSTINKIESVIKKNGWDFHILQHTIFETENSIITGIKGEEYIPNNEEHQKRYNREIIRLNLAINELLKSSNSELKTKILLLHYPPFSFEYQTTPILEEILKYNIDHVIFGHLHEIKNRGFFNRKIGETQFHLVSSDILNFNPLKIL
ncbi:metallophosphoesterase [bacterium]|nr:metallophosphoesterase [bacterium]